MTQYSKAKNTPPKEHLHKKSTCPGELDHVLNFEIRGCIQSIRANTELLKYWKVQTLDHNMVTFLDKIESNCAQLDTLVNDCLGLYSEKMKFGGSAQTGK